jgi:hypothetical protein
MSEKELELIYGFWTNFILIIGIYDLEKKKNETSDHQKLWKQRGTHSYTLALHGIEKIRNKIIIPMN